MLSVGINLGFGCGFVMILDLGLELVMFGYHFVMFGHFWLCLVRPCGHLVFGRHPWGGCWVEWLELEQAET